MKIRGILAPQNTIISGVDAENIRLLCTYVHTSYTYQTTTRRTEENVCPEISLPQTKFYKAQRMYKFVLR